MKRVSEDFGIAWLALGIDPFHPVDVFLAYDVGGSGIAQDLRLTLNVNNVLDEHPPNPEFFPTNGVGNVFNLGRVVQFGLASSHSC